MGGGRGAHRALTVTGFVWRHAGVGDDHPALRCAIAPRSQYLPGYFCPSCGARKPSNISLQVGHTGNFLGSRPGTQTLPQSATTGSPDMALSMILFLRT